MAQARRFQIAPAGCGVDLTIGSGHYTTSGVCGEMRWYTIQLCDDCRSDVAKLNTILLSHSVTQIILGTSTETERRPVESPT